MLGSDAIPPSSASVMPARALSERATWNVHGCFSSARPICRLSHHFCRLLTRSPPPFMKRSWQG
eukprot:3393859-Pleurochrysis_carterae.AAC.1